MERKLNTNNNVGLVIGATKSDMMEDVRSMSKTMPWLIPGVGAQGGSLEIALKNSFKDGMGIINISRGILYSGKGTINDVEASAKKYTEKIRSIVWN